VVSAAGLTAGEAHRIMAALPIADLGTILGGRDPLVLAPHADDESLGCGGLLAMAGSRAAVVVVTDGTGSHPHSKRYPAERLLALREAEAAAAVGELGVPLERLAFLRLRDTAAPSAGAAFEAAVDEIVAALARFECGVLLGPWRHDPHGDHLAVHAMAVAAARRAGVTHLAYPVWGWVLPADAMLDGPAPSGWRLDVEALLPIKRRAIAAHRSQYAGVIDDDPSGFQIDPKFLALFDTRFETFLNIP
jgi:LmbE family N-acetylglucosaminyl deacetylase